MKIIIKQFKDTLATGELLDVINKQLKACNLNAAGVNIYFKNYPEDLNSELPNEVEYTNLNTIVFDTEKNTITVYILANSSDFVKKAETDALTEKLEALTKRVETLEAN